MIAYLQGSLFEIGGDSVVILTGGVGYQVTVSKATLQHLSEIGANIELKIVTVVREDSFSLYGFRSASEKELFLKLLQVSGIGPKVALTILSGLSPHEFADAVRREDLVRLTAISGVGKKTAERLIVELKDKIISLLATTGESMSHVSLSPGSISEEAISALMNLGYSRQEALNALRSIPHAKDLPLEKLVREGLKALS